MSISGGILYVESGIFLSDNYVNPNSSKTFTDSVLISGSLIYYSDNYVAIDNRIVKAFTDAVLISGSLICYSDNYVSIDTRTVRTFTPGGILTVTARPGLMTDTATLIVLGFYSDFDATPRSILTDEVVQFTSTVYGPDISGYLWDFGDGTTSTEQNPSHPYGIGGTYSPSLTVTSINGESSFERKNNYITVTDQPIGNRKLYPVVSNQRLTPYKAGTDDQIQIKYQLFGDDKTRLSYLNDVPIRLKLNYSGWQSYESSTTDRTGSQTLYHSCVGISGVNSCLGYVVATIDGKIYKSNITRFNFI